MKQIGRKFTVKGINFYLGNYTPRRNEYERGLKYKLFLVNDDGSTLPTDCVFSTLNEGKKFVQENIYTWY